MSVAKSAPRLRWRLGLTGGIGSGKSTVAQTLQALGAEVIDADAVSKACTAAGGLAMPAIASHFGPEFVDPQGGLDRNRMRERVFADPQARQTLERIVHPLVAQEIARLTRLSTARVLVFDVPLLVESARWRVQLDHVLVVDCTENTQRRRVQQRSGWDGATIGAAIDAQAPRAKRLASADSVVFNEPEGIDNLQRAVRLWAKAFGL